jgi:putative addiction module killer protein
MPTQPRTLRIYETEHGLQPFVEWFKAMRDLRGQQIVAARVDRLRFGLFGDCKAVGDGVQELRVDFGPGYRVYFAQDGASLVLLLLGGSKASQRKDIVQAKVHWRNYRSGKDA